MPNFIEILWEDFCQRLWSLWNKASDRIVFMEHKIGTFIVISEKIKKILGGGLLLYMDIPNNIYKKREMKRQN